MPTSTLPWENIASPSGLSIAWGRFIKRSTLQFGRAHWAAREFSAEVYAGKIELSFRYSFRHGGRRVSYVQGEQFMLRTALTIIVLVTAFCIIRPSPSEAQAAAPEPHTEAAVIADDSRWEKAEESGDVSYIDNLLLPEYRSISVDGSIHDKNAI